MAHGLEQVTEQLSKLQLECLSGREKDGLADLIRAEFGTGGD